MNSEQPPSSPVIPSEKIAVLTASGMMIEPYDEHSFTELKKHYARMIGENPEADIFLLEGMTLPSDLRAALMECRKRGKKVRALLPIGESLQTEAGFPADAALITLQSMGLSAFGLAADTEEILTEGLERIAPITKIPLFLRKNGGTISAQTLKLLAEKGFLPLSNSQAPFFQPQGSEETALLLANERQAFFLEPDTTEISEAIPCSDGMDEVLLTASQESCDVLKIQIDTPDDAIVFAENAHMASLPVMFSSEDGVSLMLALMLYQGRALADKTCGLDEKTLKKAAAKYGAVLY